MVKQPSYMRDDGLIEINVKRYYALLALEAENAALRAALEALRVEAVSAQSYLPNSQAMDMMMAAIDKAEVALRGERGNDDSRD